MATKFTGFVARIGHKTGNGSRGPWHLYSVKLEKEDGEEYKDWITLGFRDEPPPIQEGEYITLEANTDDQGRLVFVEGSAKKPKNPPVRKSRSASGGGQSKPGYSGGAGKGRGGVGGGYQPRVRDGSGVNDRTNPEDAKRMSYANSRSAAIEVVGLLLEHKALPVSGATGKAAEAKRFVEVLAAIDKLTVEFYNDGMELRKLATVADAGVVSVAPDAELPTEQKKHDIDEDQSPDEDADTSDTSDEEQDTDESAF